MKSCCISLVLSMTFLVPASCLAAESHRLFTEVLGDHVHDGLVDYKALRSDTRLGEYIDRLARTDPDAIGSEKARFAFWINAYNAYTLKIVSDNYPIKSITDLHSGGRLLGKVLKKTVWDKPLVTINNKKTTLNAIEHEVIRPVFKDPRAHFALVCAAESCPPLRSEAYEADKLEEQLNDQGKTFLADTSKNSFDTVKRVASVSKIFSWFAEDFGGSRGAVLIYIAEFLPKDVADQIRADPNAWKVRYKEYDWSLNERQDLD